MHLGERYTTALVAGVLPTDLLKLTVGRYYRSSLAYVLPEKLQELTVGQFYTLAISPLSMPASLKVLHQKIGDVDDSVITTHL
jgi:hypothetical protein